MHQQKIKQTETKKNTQKSENPSIKGEETNNEDQSSQSKEIGGRKGLEPTRYGDWEKNGRCIDF